MGPPAERVCVVGPSPRFLSGITYYTFGVCRALSPRFRVSAILLRRLLPQRLYPASQRVGAELSSLRMPDSVHVYDGVDWFLFPSLLRAMALLARERPGVLLLQWWTASVLHTYLILAAWARLLGLRVVVEFHETVDTGELAIPVVRTYVRALAPVLFRRLAGGAIVHSAAERELICRAYGLDAASVSIVPLDLPGPTGSCCRAVRHAPEGAVNLLFFGVIRPYKGLEDLVEAYARMPADEVRRYWLTIAGEPWAGTSSPADLVGASPHRDRITLLDRYHSDDEVEALFSGADVVVLPYRRSTQSGPLHYAMGYGLPVVVTSVGGLAEAAQGYGGAVLVDAGDPDALLDGIRRAAALAGRRFPAPDRASQAATRFAEVLAPVAPAPDRAREVVAS